MHINSKRNRIKEFSMKYVLWISKLFQFNILPLSSNSLHIRCDYPILLVWIRGRATTTARDIIKNYPRPLSAYLYDSIVILSQRKYRFIVFNPRWIKTIHNNGVYQILYMSFQLTNTVTLFYLILSISCSSKAEKTQLESHKGYYFFLF